MNKPQCVDALVIGGGIHGTGIAAEAASRGLKVLLCEKADLGNGASSKTTSLISGGIQSLSRLELDVVKRSFNEQATLAKRAPHLIRHLNFSIPLNKEIRGKRSLQAGLLLYNTLRPSECKNKSKPVEINGLLEAAHSNTLHYNDCTINDARLVIINALQAQQDGASIQTYTRVESANRNMEEQCWEVQLQDSNGKQSTITAQSLINCTGKDSNITLNQTLPSSSRCLAQLLRGDHIVLPKLFDEYQGYLLQMPDKQIIYVLPYRQKYTLVGSYEQTWSEDSDDDLLGEKARQYLLDAVNTYFVKKHNDNDIIRHFWAVRSAYDDLNNCAESISYDVALDLECPNGFAPLINVFGGRLTTYRDAAEKSLELLKPYLKAEKNKQFRESTLPGGDIDSGCLDTFLDELQFGYPWLPKEYIERYARLYGTLCHHFLKSCHSLEDLGEEIGDKLHEKEVAYLVEQEWATCAEDILWRRTRMGMSFSDEQKQNLELLIKKITASA